jgi:hypothetical protein
MKGKPLNVLHELEICATFLDLLDRSRGHFVGEFAENDAILQNILIITFGNCLTQNGENPLENFLLLFLIAALHVCCKKTKININVMDNEEFHCRDVKN